MALIRPIPQSASTLNFSTATYTNTASQLNEVNVTIPNSARYVFVRGRSTLVWSDLSTNVMYLLNDNNITTPVSIDTTSATFNSLATYETSTDLSRLLIKDRKVYAYYNYAVDFGNTKDVDVWYI